MRQPFDFIDSYLQSLRTQSLPSKSEQIPILSGPEMDWFHFEASIVQLFQTRHVNLFHINRIEDTKDHIKFPLAPHRKTVSDFVFLTQGTSIRSKGLDRYEFSANTFFFLPAYQITTHEGYSQDAKGYYCHFDTEILTRNFVQPGFLNQFSFLQFIGNPLVNVDQQLVDTITPVLLRLEREHASTQPNYTMVSAYLLTLFLELLPFTRPLEKVKENAAARITQQYKNALVQHIYDKQLLTEYAQLLSVTPDYLNKCVKATTGKSAHDLLSDMVLLEAKALLKQTTLSISEIAFKIGKEDPSDFTRFFKSKTSLTPSQYRQTE
ncbi:helix-turn-helix domain-containing protein [Chitinophagaceae bacterium LB-8]|uniref:Helix-turn-helix domain-containing protein n=1 Tax=Paraflavisolibacter caeni TaxID=2982496 RepID=A0A9X2XVQ5_9BACT|nr:helix-turn-helix domain-containing protein [Paraflavisolibacter caeni]MCU7549730.1 helix-turn-helix domain-containing protein [Paraflavisolibacter caeni]